MCPFTSKAIRTQQNQPAKSEGVTSDNEPTPEVQLPNALNLSLTIIIYFMYADFMRSSAS